MKVRRQEIRCKLEGAALRVPDGMKVDPPPALRYELSP